MDRAQWDRIQEIYYLASLKPPSKRSAFIATACENESACIDLVNSLFKAKEDLGDFMDSPVLEDGLRILASTLDEDEDNENLNGKLVANRYLVVAELTAGGMGRVYKALDQNLHNQTVVIKVPSLSIEPNSFALFEREALALTRIHHPNVVRASDHGKLEDGTPYLVMEYVDGKTLRLQIDSGGMDLQRAASILKQIGAGLSAAHQKGILHRDLKPENILIQTLSDGTELIKIVDFGIARVENSGIGPLTMTQRPIGTVVYMSPEQLMGRHLTKASDIYSMAVLAYEMITGCRPFNASSAAEIAELQRQGVKAMPCFLRPQLNPKAQKVILKGLSLKARKRHQEANEFGATLANALLKDKGDGPLVKLLIAAALLIAVAALSGYEIYHYRKTSTTKVAAHSFKYWFMIQKMRYSAAYQDPDKSNGDETFNGGDRFKINMVSEEPAYVYIFNEAPAEPGVKNFTLEYPRVNLNDGAATIGANQPLETDSLQFKGQKGADNVWFVWSSEPVDELEKIKSEAFKNPDRGITGESLIAVKAFLQTKEAETKPKTRKSSISQEVSVRGPGKLLVIQVSLNHK
jgi:serine/threonine protein kinase